MDPRPNLIQTHPDPPTGAFKRALKACRDPVLSSGEPLQQDFPYVLWCCIIDAWEEDGMPLSPEKRNLALSEILGDGSPPTIIRRKALESCYLMLGKRGFIDMMKRYGYKKIASFEEA